MAQNGELVMGDVWARGGKVIDPLELFYRERKAPDKIVNCRGLVAAPGFIDIQINGKCFVLIACNTCIGT